MGSLRLGQLRGCLVECKMCDRRPSIDVGGGIGIDDRGSLSSSCLDLVHVCFIEWSSSAIGTKVDSSTLYMKMYNQECLSQDVSRVSFYCCSMFHRVLKVT